ncbi:MAG: hypothetical protein WA821_22805 [Anaerolineales bacterium]
MAKGGKKYRLLIYEHMLGRWWSTTLALAFAIAAWGGATVYLSGSDKLPAPLLSRDDGIFLLVVGGVVLLFTIFLFMIRKMAYIQLFADHFKLATPFLRLNVSYKRILSTTTTQVSSLFPPKSMSGQQQDIIAPIAGNTVIIIHLKSYPLSRAVLKFFLSPFFFHDNTPHFVIMVDNWMGFSQELESLRVGGGKPPPRKKASTLGIPSLLDDLHKK